MVQWSARAVLMAYSTARRLMTGSTPGIPRQMGQVCVFGGSPNFVLQPQNILERVSSSACTSRPMTASSSGMVNPRSHCQIACVSNSYRVADRFFSTIARLQDD